MKKILLSIMSFCCIYTMAQAMTLEQLRTPDTTGLAVTRQEYKALTFIYQYMPIADITDYSTAFHLANIRTTLRTRDEMPWGKQIPDLLFNHFVMPLRVNNEALDLSRIIFYKELRERVKGLTMEQAILEVNHWCHEHVTYQPSDARTLSPLACMATAIGRCGEESTFTVAALRAIGIPARQVYTPRWAHTDDNHAWVEAWANGKWHFIGACEPEAVLDLAWFNAPASRAMLMHTRAFGDYNGPEEVMSRTRNFTEINLIGNYAKTSQVAVKVCDHNGAIVEGAKVQFKIYNYGEFYPAATKYTNKSGITTLTAGRGDMLVWASHNGWYGYQKATFGKNDTINITLNRSNQLAEQGISYAELDIVPPKENAYSPQVAPELAALNKKRFEQEDSIRKAYESTFLTIDEANSIYPNAATHLVKARSNWRTILEFIQRHPDNQQRAIEVLNGLNDKDMRDVSSIILEDAYLARSNQLSQRVEYEMITAPYKLILQDAFDEKTTESFRKDPSLLITWVQKNLTLMPQENALQIAQTPMGVWRSRITDNRGRDIFFVALARSLDIEAREDPITGKVQFRTTQGWQDVNFDQVEQKNAATGVLKLNYTPTTTLDDPKYYYHFSISRILDDGTTQLLNYDEGDAGLEDGAAWSNTFRNGTQLDAGKYILTTGTRAANGSVLATNSIFSIEPSKVTTVNLVMRQSDELITVIGNFDSESKFQLLNSEFKPIDHVSILSQTGRGYFIVGLLGVGLEPTNHAMRDIAKMHDEIDNYSYPMVLLFENESDANKYRQENYGQLPSHIIYGIDADGEIKKQITTKMKLKEGNQLPIFLIADTFNRVVFVSQGYTIGLGEQLTKVLNGLQK